MTATFTPGPWCYAKCEELGSTHFYIAQKEGAEYTPNYSDVAFSTCPGEYVDIQEANARLIVVAPKLLGIAIRLVEEGLSTSLVTEARAVINEAIGG